MSWRDARRAATVVIVGAINEDDPPTVLPRRAGRVRDAPTT